MKKILTPLIVVLILAGSAYAALVAWLFPNTWDFPRVPQANGTLGHILANILGIPDIEPYVGDWTVNNTLALNGITSTWYLQHGTCTVIDQVWTSITPEWTAICDLKWWVYGQVMWTLTWVVGSIKVYDHNGLEKTWIIDGFTLHFGDIVETLGSSSGTIAFSDASIIRLDELSTVELSGGTNSDGDSIAQVILRDGNLWWRVLTSTGINFEAGGYIAWVRGTSISVEESGPWFTFAIIDSLANGNDAATFSAGVGTDVVSPQPPSTEVSSGATFTTTNWLNVTTSTKSDLLSGNAWRSSNTLSDIEYLYALISDPTGVAPGLTLTPIEITELITKAENEVDLTIPKISNCTNITNCSNDPWIKECIALGWTTEACQKVNIEPDNIPSTLAVVDGGSDTVEKKRWRQELRARDLLCDKKHNWVFWPTVGKCVKRDPSRWTIIWMADYTTTTTPPPNSRFNDPSLFVEQDIRYTSLLNPNRIAWTNTQTALIGRNFVISSQYEKYYGKTITDDCRNDSTIPEWWTVWETWTGYKKATIWTPTYGLRDIDKNNFYNNNKGDIFSTSLQYDTLYIKNPDNHTCWREEDGWQINTFYDGVWLRKNSNNILPGTSWVEIMNTWDYIAYPLSEMGGKSSLNGVTITIEYAGTPNNNRSLLYLWWSNNIKWDEPLSTWRAFGPDLDGLSQALSLNWNPWSISIRVKSINDVSQFIIWNTMPNLNNAIWITIKRITITK
jgi:hypothetical protein